MTEKSGEQSGGREARAPSCRSDRRPTWGFLAIVSVACALSFIGCPSNLCLLTVNGKCEWSTCPDGAEFNDVRKSCACRTDRIALGGGCLTLQAANEFCGKGMHFEAGGCVPIRCPTGLTIDQETGTCITGQQAGQLATNLGVAVGQNQTLGCPPGQTLVVEGQQASCVPVQQTCARDEQWDGRACRKLAQCPPGSSFDATRQACVRFTTPGSDQKAYTVDLGTWVHSSYGPDGGEGTKAFCGPIGKHPAAFGVGAGGSMPVRVLVGVQAPDQNVGHATVSTSGFIEGSGQPVPGKGAEQLQQAAAAILTTLTTGGGRSSAPQAATSVRCVIVNASKPTAVSVTGGA